MQKILADAEQKRARIQAMVAGGKSLDDGKRALRDEDVPVQPGATRFANFTETTYQEFTKK